MRLVWQVPFGSLLLDTLQSILLPLLLNIALLALALFGYTTFRHLPARSTQVAPNLAANNELRVLRAMKRLFPFCRWDYWYTIRKQTARLSAIKLPTTCCRI